MNRILLTLSLFLFIGSYVIAQSTSYSFDVTQKDGDLFLHSCIDKSLYTDRLINIQDKDHSSQRRIMPSGIPLYVPDATWDGQCLIIKVTPDKGMMKEIIAEIAPSINTNQIILLFK